MKKINLSQKEINELWIAHHATKEKREADRIKAVCLLAVGYSVGEIAKILMIGDETVRNFWKRYLEGGVKNWFKITM